ncbi:MAG: energy transducer TonB [Telmatospirillum sp.]|nr:energy transducer TonB [Telmatospirillum sp.]
MSFFFQRSAYVIYFAGLLLAYPAVAADAPAAYVRTVLTQVSSKVEYPKMAKLRHQQGVVGIRIALDGSGGVTRAELAQSSGIQSLDDAALAAVQNASPFPAPPEAGTVVTGNIQFNPD